ncbi:MAG TPA: molybdopterin dinucleotide binding domain-containing protein, partial [Methylomirabilota bacterium]|nr:molybdopterin dinucleotide binding domain-containing protein [Methylomirabilota bacterium]
MSAMDRRSFFKIIATTGAAAASGCQQSAETLLPYVTPPENIVPGVAAYYATVCRECPVGCGLIARNREGRIVKLEGNPDHPVNSGTLCIRGQAGLQGLYHPDRYRGALVGGKLAPWDEAEKQVADKLAALLKAGRGDRIALVSGLETGSLGRLMEQWLRALAGRAPYAPPLLYEPLDYEPIRLANRLVFGRESIPDYAIGDAAFLLSFGADFLETWISPVGYALDFARMHAFSGGKAGTFVHVEPRQSMTAANADEWIRNAPGTEGLVAMAMLKVIVDEGLARGGDAGALRAAVKAVDLAAAASASGVAVETIKRVAHDFAASKGGLAIGGGAAVSGSNATETLVAINLLNVAAGAVGKLVRFGPDSAFGRTSGYARMASLVRAMGQGEIEVLILVDVNPVYTMPAQSGFAAALARVPLVVALASRPTETTARAHVVLPILHPLESWGDYVAEDGVIGLLQPAMAPVEIGGKPVDAKPTGDILLSVGRLALGTEEGKGPLKWATFVDFLKDEWKRLAKEYGAGQPFGDFWEAALKRGGVWRDVASAAVSAKVDAGRLPSGTAKLDGDGTHALIVYPSARFYDGRGADKPWLQETPDAMTLITWDGWVEVPAETAAKLDLRRGDVVRITSPHGSIELPAYPSASLHPGAVAVAMGQGHAYPGGYAKHGNMPPGATTAPGDFLNVGANPMALLGGGADAATGGLPYLQVKVSLSKTNARRPLAIPQA